MRASFPRTYAIAFFSIACLLPLAGVAQERIPNVKLTVATQLEEDGVLGSEINVLALRCFEGACRLTTMVLNRCISVNGKTFQIPFTFGGTTQGGDISVTRSGNSLSVEEVNTDVFGDTKTTYRFVLAANQPSALMATKLKDFSGVYVKDSRLAGKLITVKFVPLRGEYERVDLACPLELPGVPRAGE